MHTDGEISGEILETNIRQSNRIRKKNRRDTAEYHIPETFGVRKIKLKYIVSITGNPWTRVKGRHNQKKYKRHQTSFPEMQRHPDHRREIEEKRECGKCHIRFIPDSC